MKICVVKTSSMGDVIHTLPALTDAQNAIPDLEVDWVVEPAFAEIPSWHSAIKNVIPFALRKWRKQWFSKQTWQAYNAFKQQLQAERYDAVIDAQGLFKSAFFATRLAKGMKCGYDQRSAREGISAHFYDKKFAIAYQQHAVERIRQLFAQSLGYPLPQTVGDYGLAAHFAKSPIFSPPCQPYLLGIHATTRADKHWQEAHWLALFKQLAEQHLTVRLPWGNELEKARAERFANQAENVEVLPKLNLTQLAGQIAGATAVVSVDTGLSHLTAALDKPNVILYGATDPNLIGAYGKHQHYLTGKGMENITPNQVWEALQPLMFRVA